MKVRDVQTNDPVSAATNEVIDDLARFVQIIRSDPELLKWFQSLEQRTSLQRNNEIVLMAEKMASQTRYRDLATSLALLSHNEIFEALSQTLRDCRKPSTQPNPGRLKPG
jgi:hypothetical protein